MAVSFHGITGTFQHLAAGSLAVTVPSAADCLVVVATGYRIETSEEPFFTKLNWDDGSGVDFDEILTQRKRVDKLGPCVGLYVMTPESANWPGSGASTLYFEAPSDPDEGINIGVMYFAGVDPTVPINTSESSDQVTNWTSSLTGVHSGDLTVGVAFGELGAIPDPIPTGYGQSYIWEASYNSAGIGIGYKAEESAFRLEGTNIVPAAFVLSKVIHNVTTSGGVIVNGDEIKIEGGATVAGAAYITGSLREISSGGAVLSGTAAADADQTFTEVVSGGIKLGGTIYPPLRISGSADYHASHESRPTSGGIRVSPISFVSPYLPLGGVLLGGKHKQIFSFEVAASGSIEVAGAAEVERGEYAYTASGQVILSSAFEFVSSAWHYETDGNIIFLTGTYTSNFIDYGTQWVKLYGDIDLFEVVGTYKDQADAEALVQPSGQIKAGGCTDLPYTLNMRHNVDVSNALTEFLLRNDYAIAEVLPLYYNTNNETWQHNIHLSGQSARGNYRERWDLLFEVKATDTLGGSTLGRKLWILGIRVTRKNLLTGADADTRILVAMMPEEICLTNELKFVVQYDTLLDSIVLEPNAVVVYQKRLYDDIGLFKNYYWVNTDSVLEVSVSQSVVSRHIPAPLQELDIYSPVYTPYLTD